MSDGSIDKRMAGADGDSTLKAGVYQALMAFHIYCDGLMWSRVQTLFLLQGAVLGAGYAVPSKALATMVLAIGAAFTAILFHLVSLDEKYRDINLPLMKQLEAEAGVSGMETTENGAGWGGMWLRIVIWACVAADSALLILRWSSPGLFEVQSNLCTTTSSDLL